MVDAIISTAVGKANAIISNEVNLLRGVKDEVSDLSKKLEMIKDVLDDAEKRGVKEATVKNWLKKLEDTAYEMDDILDEWSYSLLKHKKVPQNLLFVMALPNWLFMFISNIRRCIPTSCLCFEKFVDRHDTAMKVKDVKLKLDQILKEKNDFKFETSLPTTDHVPTSWRPHESISSIDFKKVYGQDINNNKKDIVRRLMINDDRQILCIVGMGGLGKTTLAKMVYNDPQVVKNDCFELRIWICVSDPFDVAKIARGIVQSVKKKSIPPNTYQLELVMEKLRNCILGKKFLLVLDDVWTDKYEEWEPLKINLKDGGAAGSKILVTTRKERVAKMMGTLEDDICRPQPLSDKECWSLLRCISLPGRSDEECGEFEDVGKKIAIKCNGLPLAANVLGSHLQFKHSLEDWKEVLKSEIWQLEKEEKIEIFPHLILSYNELSPTLKRCFSYLAIYPKDYEIRAVQVIEEWMALGYLGSVVGNGRVELKGRDYFDNLAMHSLLQDSHFEEIGEKIGWCKMHDIVHDFAQFLRKNDAPEMKKKSCQVCEPLVSEAQEYRTLFLKNDTPLVLCDCLTSLRVLRFFSARERLAPPRMEKLIHLRLLDLGNTKLSKEDLKIICRLYLLQTLLLVDCTLEEIPEEFRNLDGLRKLDLSMNALRKLPKSICSLLELQTISLAGCSLEEIGEEIGNMVGLRHLDLSDNGELKELPESICGLLELQILNLCHCYHLNGLPERIHMLENLQQLLMRDTPVRNCMPKGVGLLSGLRALGLKKFKVGSGRNKLGLLKNLNRLTGRLRLGIELSSMSDLEELVEDARDAQLRNKIHLQSFSIEFKGHKKEWWSSSLWMNVIEALEPNQKLKDLEIWEYKGCRLPHWISSPLNLVKEISLGFCSELSSLPHMGKLPLLEYLYINELHELKVVGREFLGIESSSTQHVVAFPKLKKLTFTDFYKWEEWEDITLEEEESTAVSVMPCLALLEIKFCRGLKKLPHRLLRKASSLQSLAITYSPKLEKSYGDKDGSAWRSISQYNPQLQLIFPFS